MSKSEKAHKFIHPLTHHIFTDGSFRPPDNASCAYLIFSEKKKHVVAINRFACRGRTINQMELEAVNKALDHPNMDYVIIYSDSQYTISALTLWRHNWAKNNWVTPLGEPVKNKELIQEIIAKMETKKFVRFEKVKAHTGDYFNSVVDFLVQDLTERMRDDPTLPDGKYTV